jgi:hypothetical protein
MSCETIAPERYYKRNCFMAGSHWNMITVSSLAGPQDAELEDQIKGYPSEATVEEALKQQRGQLEALYEKRKRAAGDVALKASAEAPEAPNPEAASPETPESGGSVT